MKTKIYLTTTAVFVSLLSFAQPGSLDETFGRSGKVTTVFGQYGSVANAVAIQADKKIVAAGYQFNASNHEFEVIRYNSDGSRDNTFGIKGNVHTLIDSTCHAYAITIQTDGKIVVAGSCSDFTTTSMAVARYNDDGTPDLSFNKTGTAIISFGNFSSSAYSVLIQPDGKIVLGGYMVDENNGDILKFALARLKNNGTPDSNFGNRGKITSGFNGKYAYIYKILLQPDNKIVAAGTLRNTKDDDFAVIRYNANGSIDESFGGTGKLVADFGGTDEGHAAALQPDGKIIVAGTSNINFNYSFAMIRYKKNGTPDNSFGINGKVANSFNGKVTSGQAIALQSNGKILVAGYGGPEHPITGNYADFAVARFEVNGDPDNNFGTGGLVKTDFRRNTDEAHDILIQPNGKIVVAGLSTSPPVFALARYNAGSSGLAENIVTKTNSAGNIQPALSLYPNPAHHELHVTGLTGLAENRLSIVDAGGNILKTISAKQQELHLDIQNLPVGVYYLRIQQNNKTVTLKFIKQ